MRQRSESAPARARDPGVDAVATSPVSTNPVTALASVYFPMSKQGSLPFKEQLNKESNQEYGGLIELRQRH